MLFLYEKLLSSIAQKGFSVSLVSSKQQTTSSVKSADPTGFSISSKKLNTSSSKQEINILLLGEVGVGKTTFINALANYLVSDTFEQAINDKMQAPIPSYFHYVLEDGTFEEKIITIGRPDERENCNENGKSCTQNCRSFVFSIGDQLLRLINTPGTGYTQGVEQDTKIFNEMITFISKYEYLNGICILLKPNQERLTVVFRYYVKEFLRHLHKSTMGNIAFVFTNARSTFFRPGSSLPVVKSLLNQLEQEHDICVPFTRENTFLLDNESFRALALCKSGIQLSQEGKSSYICSWGHTVRECARLLAFFKASPIHTVRHTVSLYEVQQILRVPTMITSKFLSLSQINSLNTKEQDQLKKVQNVYDKLCKFLEVNSVLPFNEDLLDYIRHFIREEQVKKSAGAQNDDVIHHLETMLSNYTNEIELLKKTMKHEKLSSNKTELIEAKDIFPLAATLYDLPISGPEIRKQIEELKLNQNITEKRETTIILPSKAASSKLIYVLNEVSSKSN